MSITRDLTIKIKKYLAKEEVLLIVGPRQAGKTTVLHQIESFLKKENHISYFLNLEDPDYIWEFNSDIWKSNFQFLIEFQ
mgnify:CR=1 FL=1